MPIKTNPPTTKGKYLKGDSFTLAKVGRPFFLESLASTGGLVVDESGFLSVVLAEAGVAGCAPGLEPAAGG